MFLLPSVMLYPRRNPEPSFPLCLKVNLCFGDNVLLLSVMVSLAKNPMLVCNCASERPLMCFLWFLNIWLLHSKLPVHMVCPLFYLFRGDFSIFILKSCYDTFDYESLCWWHTALSDSFTWDSSFTLLYFLYTLYYTKLWASQAALVVKSPPLPVQET